MASSPATFRRRARRGSARCGHSALDSGRRHARRQRQPHAAGRAHSVRCRRRGRRVRRQRTHAARAEQQPHRHDRGARRRYQAGDGERRRARRPHELAMGHLARRPPADARGRGGRSRASGHALPDRPRSTRRCGRDGGGRRSQLRYAPLRSIDRFARRAASLDRHTRQQRGVDADGGASRTDGRGAEGLAASRRRGAHRAARARAARGCGARARYTAIAAARFARRRIARLGDADGQRGPTWRRRARDRHRSRGARQRRACVPCDRDDGGHSERRGTAALRVHRGYRQGWGARVRARGGRRNGSRAGEASLRRPRACDRTRWCRTPCADRTPNR